MSCLLAQTLRTTVIASKAKQSVVHCFKDGEFVEDMTLEEATAKSAGYADMAGMTKEQALEISNKVLPTLKRWKQ